MEKRVINFKEIGFIAQSKSEVYRALTVGDGYFLPPYKETSMLFISQIATGEKKAKRVSQVEVCNVPHVKGLRTKDLIEFLIDECNGQIYLPDNFIEFTPNRQCLAQLLRFKAFVANKLQEREQHLLESQNLTMEVDKDFADVFAKTQMISVQKGRSHHLLRKAILKRTKDIEKEEEHKKAELLSSIPGLRREIAELKEQLREKDCEMVQYEADSDILKNLFDKGIIDGDGNYIGSI